jgi:ryanodine receptor 2
MPEDYVPEPIDTSHIDLPEELVSLTEVLAKSTHDNWASQRILDGWSYGPHRDDKLKTHPSLVPYEQLPEAEKVYDRRSAMETLKAMLSLGFKISRR